MDTREGDLHLERQVKSAPPPPACEGNKQEESCLVQQDRPQLKRRLKLETETDEPRPDAEDSAATATVPDAGDARHPARHS